jgi:hypothetical protein
MSDEKEPFSSPREPRPPAFGGGFVNSVLYCAFLVIDVPLLKLKGLKYSMFGLACSKANAIQTLERIVSQRNEKIKTEHTYLDLESVKFNVDEACIQAYKLEALKKLPKDLTAWELSGRNFDEMGRILHEPLTVLLDHSTGVDDINSILT